MLNHLIFAGAVLLLTNLAIAADGATTRPASVLAYTVADIHSNPVDLSKYKGKVLLVVNVASKCGYTPQYADLEKIYETYKDKGLAILAFPANEFGGQEPGTNAQILDFCTSTYDVKFDMFSKIVVKGATKAPLYQFLTSTEDNGQYGGEIQWNFTKFLVSRDGKTVARFEPKVKPTDAQAITAIEAELARK
jgi:glutathione peroxidase